MARSFSRRTLLTRLGFIGGATALGVAPFVASKFSASKHHFFSACNDRSGNHFVASIDESGQIDFCLPVGNRGHHMMTDHQQKTLVMFARSPGKIAEVVDLESGEITASFTADTNHHFCGHGLFSKDDQYLLTCESDYHRAMGVICVRSRDNYKVVERFYSGGTGPHQVAWLNDQKTMVIANGGLQTHPARDSEVLNVASLYSNLTYLDSQSGHILEQQTLTPAALATNDTGVTMAGTSMLSIRHLAVSEANEVVIGLQQQGEFHDYLPLVALHSQGKELALISAPELVQLSMNGYTASVAVDSNSGHAVITCPKGDQVTFWDFRNQQFVSSKPFAGCSGVAFDAINQAFIVSNDLGEIRFFNSSDFSELKERSMRFSQLAWDNHMHWA